MELATLFCDNSACRGSMPCANCKMQASKIEAEMLALTLQNAALRKALAVRVIFLSAKPGWGLACCICESRDVPRLGHKKMCVLHPGYSLKESGEGRMRTVRNRLHPCPKCRHPEFKVGKAFDGRPDFLCTNCDYSWTSGHDGGEYLARSRPARSRPGRDVGER